MSVLRPPATYENALNPLTLLAYEMNDQPLNHLHGAPLRLRVENQLGFKMVKWIQPIEFVDDVQSINQGEGGCAEDHEHFGELANICHLRGAGVTVFERKEDHMELGMIGLGRMGTNMVRRLLRAGHQCVVYDLHSEAVQALVKEGAVGAASPEDFAHKLKRPRAAWMMVPAAVVDPTLKTLIPLIERDDVIIDGGNSYYHDDIRRAAELKPKGIHYVDVGTSGGVFGLERGYSQMIGGDEVAIRRLEPIFAALAPGIESAPRTPGRKKTSGTAEHGYLHCGPSGAGHFVKMVHNGIEYGIMAAYAEGLNILHHANAGNLRRTVDAETTPLRHPEHYPYDLNLADIAEVWRRGSVIASWLLDLTALALLKSPDLAKFAGRVSDSGEGRWTVMAAIDESVPAPVLSAALYERFSSRGEADFADKVLSALRYEFGGHEEKAAAKKGGA